MLFKYADFLLKHFWWERLPSRDQRCYNETKSRLESRSHKDNTEPEDNDIESPIPPFTSAFRIPNSIICLLSYAF
jgi:hypothetical protein